MAFPGSSSPCQTLSISQLAQLARNAGFSGAGLVEIVAHALVESGGNTCAYNAGSGAAGVLQFIPSTARGIGLSDPYDPQASFNAAYKLSRQGTDFSDWTPYEPSTALAAAMQRVEQAIGGGNTAPAGAPAAADGLRPGGPGCPVSVDPWGLGQAICDAGGGLVSLGRATGTRLGAGAQMGLGLVLLVAGIAVVAVIAGQTPSGRRMLSAGREVGRAILGTVTFGAL